VGSETTAGMEVGRERDVTLKRCTGNFFLRERILGLVFTTDDVITRVAGIEPTQTVLKTVVLPLNYTPLFC
jgi:hypothetical protein